MNPESSADTQAFLSGVADQIEAEAAKLESVNGVHSAPAASESRPNSSAQFLSKTVYTASYTVAYGVCFPIFLACRYVPKQNPFVNGLVDGSESANQSAEEVVDRVNDWVAARKQGATSSLDQVVESGAEALTPA